MKTESKQIKSGEKTRKQINFEKKIRAEATIKILIRPEDLQLRGNCLASGDAAEDERAAVEIEGQLDSGNDWAWCAVEVRAEWKGLESSDYLGGCSYRNEADFKISGYYDDMKDAALSELCIRAWAIAQA